MISYIQRQFKSKKGFTLVELMVVVGIIGILVAIAVPVYNNATKNAADVANEANIRTIKSAISMYLASEGDLDVSEAGEYFYGLVPNYLMEEPKNPYQSGNDAGKSYVISIKDDQYEVKLDKTD